MEFELQVNEKISLICRIRYNWKQINTIKNISFRWSSACVKFWESSMVSGAKSNSKYIISASRLGSNNFLRWNLRNTGNVFKKKTFEMRRNLQFPSIVGFVFGKRSFDCRRCSTTAYFYHHWSVQNITIRTYHIYLRLLNHYFDLDNNSLNWVTWIGSSFIRWKQ